MVLVSIKEFAAGISVKEILEYYAILCLILMPATIYVLIYLNKKTKAIQKLNSFLDKFLGLENTEKVSQKIEEDTQKKELETQADADEKSGITSFNILVGDKYFCRVNSTDSTLQMRGISWSTENDFVGKINKKEGVFTARKKGKVKIYFNDDSDAFSNGVQLYDINVLARKQDWFADNIIDKIYKNALRDEVSALFIDRHIIKENKRNNIVIYEGKNRDEKKIHIQYNAKGEILRALWEIDCSDENTIAELNRNLNERFDNVPGEGDISIWIREVIDEKRDEVEIYSFWKKISVNTVFFGIGKTWREYGDVEEFLLNIGMCEKMFSEIIDTENYSDFIVDKKYLEYKKAGTNAEPEKPDNVTNVLQETPDPAPDKADSEEDGPESTPDPENKEEEQEETPEVQDNGTEVQDNENSNNTEENVDIDEVDMDNGLNGFDDFNEQTE